MPETKTAGVPGFGVGGYRLPAGTSKPQPGVPKGVKSTASKVLPVAKGNTSQPKPQPVQSQAATNRVDGRLQRIALVKEPSGPTRDDFQRKVEEMERGEAAPLGSLDATAVTGSDVPTTPLFTASDILRAVIFSELLGKPKGRR